MQAPLRRIEPGPLLEWGFEPALWQAPERLTLLVLASRLFADQQERIAFFQAVLGRGHVGPERVTLRKADGSVVPATADARIVAEGQGFALHVGFRVGVGAGAGEPAGAGSGDPSRPDELGATSAAPGPATPPSHGGASEVSATNPMLDVRTLAFDALAVPDAGRTADRLVRFLDWVRPRRSPLCVAGPDSARLDLFLDLVHRSRGLGGTMVRIDGELEPTPSFRASLEEVYTGTTREQSGVVVRRIDLGRREARELLVAIAGALVRRERDGPPLYVSAVHDAPIVTQLAEEAGADVFTIPALVDRRQDVLPVLSRWLRRPRAGLRAFQTISPDAAHVLQAYRWPGDVDELHELAESARHISGGTELRLADLPVHLSEGGMPSSPLTRPRVPIAAQGKRGRPKKTLSIEQIRDALRACDGSRTRAAEMLGVSRTTLWRKIAELGEALADDEPHEPGA